MKYRVAVFVCCFVSFAQSASANMTTALKESYGLTKVTLEVLAMCGSSQGRGYFFKHELFNPSGGSWLEDGISNGQITLVRDGEEVDILFGDAVGSTGYRQDGAQVIILHFGDKFIRVGAFADNYTDIYNFDRLEKKLAWSSNKSGPLMGKVSVYESNCTAVY